MAAPAKLARENVLAWRLGRQFLEPLSDADAPTVVRRLCGVQAQVGSAAALAVDIRRRRPEPGEVGRALAERRLMRTWAMRGTLHLLHPADAGAFLSLLAAARVWEKGAWQRSFLTADRMARLAEAAHETLDGPPLTRDELIAGVLERTGDADLADRLRSGWSAVLKPLAWQGLLCNGEAAGNRVTFTRPDRWLEGWAGLPEPEQAARVAIPAYLGAYGPASIEVFDQWLSRGASRKPMLRGWFADLAEQLVVVEVDGAAAYARAADVDAIAASRPSEAVRLLPAFDQYVLGPGTGDAAIIPAGRRAAVSRAAGWISPVVASAGRVAGTWEIAESTLAVTLFREAGPVSADALAAETSRIGSLLGRSLTLSRRTS